MPEGQPFPGFTYYERHGRLFRARRYPTERWDGDEWVDIGNALLDWYRDLDVDLDDLTEDEARATFPNAFATAPATLSAATSDIDRPPLSDDERGRWYR
ncbi:hypothetical protein [Agromyces seonyuensis]|uniref:Uncharacterized protein n=1 Tax=Agromyces seonyuensis TaxID=2662446 RepID=A0A6I4P2Y5_9MICO|nr:hypothetical protein [Agromyces seonyuensis]MWB97657.1 hypothetical protein [Agromyces seonyuensis]